MKTLTTFTCATAAALLLSLASNSSGGTITIGNPPQPSFSPGAVFSNNTITAQQTSPSLVRILGNTTIIIPTGTSSASIILTGSFAAMAGDIASYFYNFNIALNSNSPATFNLTLATDNFLIPTLMTGNQAIAANSSQGYAGSGASPMAPIPLSGNFTATLTFNFSTPANATDGASDTLILTIPGNSIDFQVAPTAIPEPSTYALLGLGLAGLAVWSRRRSIATT